MGSMNKIHFCTHNHHCRAKQLTTQGLKTKIQLSPCKTSIHSMYWTTPTLTVKKWRVYPSEPLKNIQYLLFCDRLVCGFWVGFWCRSKNGVNVDINKRKQLRVERSGGFTELPVNPVLEKKTNHATMLHSRAEKNHVFCWSWAVIITNNTGHILIFLGNSYWKSQTWEQKWNEGHTLMDTLCLVNDRLLNSW